ncbi:MAG TPA: hypothetical protein VH227_01495 [Candidatus Udaeobacter sp.]|jgi:hypothetical protein|nr:hypothetical protein [Candidatus Udaeobacter sp.]
MATSITAADTRCVQDTRSTRFSVEGHWWLFCFLILALNFVLLALDPLPKLFLGDSKSYLWTALWGWIPHDRSFFYGYIIRWSSLRTESLTSLMILQTFLGAITSILVALICRWIFQLSLRCSCLFGFLCAIDPLQLVWQRYVMTETISLFVYVLMLLLSFCYLDQRRLWQLFVVELLGLLLISFRMSYLLVVQVTMLLLPLIAFFPEIRTAFCKCSSRTARMFVARSAGVHMTISILVMMSLQQGYQRLNGWLAGREPAYLHSSGLTLLATWAPALQPTDSPDPRLAALLARREQLRLGDVGGRNAQLYMPDHLINLWEKTEPNAAICNRVAKQTAVHALFHRPWRVLKLSALTFLDYWNFPAMRKKAKADMKTTSPWDNELSKAAAKFHVVPPRPQHAKIYRLLQRYQVIAQPYYYIVLVAPFFCACLIFFVPKGYCFLLCLHSWILLGTITLFSMGPTARYLQPLSLLTILIFAVLVKSLTDRRSRAPSAALPTS